MGDGLKIADLGFASLVPPCSWAKRPGFWQVARQVLDGGVIGGGNNHLETGKVVAQGSDLTVAAITENHPLPPGERLIRRGQFGQGPRAASDQFGEDVAQQRSFASSRRPVDREDAASFSSR